MQFLNILASIIVLLSLPALAGPGPHFYPQVAYRDEPCTLAFRGEPGQTARVHLEGELLAEQPFLEAIVELSLRLPAEGRLAVTIGDATFAFEVVGPASTVPLTSQDAVLFADQVPAILLADHHLPPAPDRRWETVRVVKNAVDDQRPRISALTLLGGGWLPAETRQALAADLWQPARRAEGFYAIDSAICSVPLLAPPQAIVISLGADDLRHGHRERVYRMKLEWLLQALAARFPNAPRFLLSLPLAEPELAQWPTMDETLRLAATSNETIFVNGYFHRLSSVTAETMNEAVLPHLRRVAAWP